MAGFGVGVAVDVGVAVGVEVGAGLGVPVAVAVGVGVAPEQLIEMLSILQPEFEALLSLPMRQRKAMV